MRIERTSLESKMIKTGYKSCVAYDDSISGGYDGTICLVGYHRDVEGWFTPNFGRLDLVSFRSANGV